MKVPELMEIIGEDHFYTGVPDSLLNNFCRYVMDKYGIGENHVIGVNEGACTSLAAGRYLSTGKIPVIYMQNSGIGNTINPTVSLISKEVYGIPCIYLVGWRGEPGNHDEPQHMLQGKITPALLESSGLETLYLTKDTKYDDFKRDYEKISTCLKDGKSLAIIVSKGALEYEGNYKQSNNNKITREDAINTLLDCSGKGLFISTTGKTSRELFELRKKRGEPHDFDFLTVGSMGYSSSIALGIATGTDCDVWCLDGDGSMLMHMGAMSMIGLMKPPNYFHVLFNNESHESVGGYPTPITSINMCKVAESCGYASNHSVSTTEELKSVLVEIKKYPGPHFVEVKVTIGSRNDLGRPTITPIENKQIFMNKIRGFKQ
ncbi:MAG: phosphonopyruvate decarboxylase [Bacilli bacterium]